MRIGWVVVYRGERPHPPRLALTRYAGRPKGEVGFLPISHTRAVRTMGPLPSPGMTECSDRADESSDTPHPRRIANANLRDARARDSAAVARGPSTRKGRGELSFKSPASWIGAAACLPLERSCGFRACEEIRSDLDFMLGGVRCSGHRLSGDHNANYQCTFDFADFVHGRRLRDGRQHAAAA